MIKLNRKRVALTFLTIFVVYTAALIFLGTIQQKRNTSVELGIPHVQMDGSGNITSSITQITATQEQIFVVYGYESVVEVYTLGGDYEYSIEIYNHRNGRTEIAASQGKLYICDKIHNVYVFSGTEFIEYVDRNDSAALRNKVNPGRSSPEYQTKFGSVWYCSSENGSYCVIDKPFWNALFQNNFLELALLILLIIGFLLRFPVISKRPL